MHISLTRLTCNYIYLKVNQESSVFKVIESPFSSADDMMCIETRDEAFANHPGSFGHLVFAFL